MVNNSYLLGVGLWGILIANITCFWSILLFYKEHVIDMFLLRDNTIRIKEGKRVLPAKSKQANGAPIGIFIILYFTGLISSTPPFSSLCSCSPFTHLCNLDENTLQALISKLGFAWLQSHCWSLCYKLFFFLISSLRPKKHFQKEGGKEENWKKQNISFWTCTLRSLGLGFSSANEAVVSCFMGTYLLPLCV